MSLLSFKLANKGRLKYISENDKSKAGVLQSPAIHCTLTYIAHTGQIDHLTFSPSKELFFNCQLLIKFNCFLFLSFFFFFSLIHRPTQFDTIEYVKSIDPRVIIIDGKKLTEYMMDFNLGVTTSSTYEIKKVDNDYFHDEE